MVALPESFDPDKTDVPQSGLELLLFRLSSQEQALARIQSRAANLMLISLTMVGLHLGLLTFSDPPNWAKVAGVSLLTVLLLLTGFFFSRVYKQGTFATPPAPDVIIQRLWHEGPVAMWFWSLTLKEAIRENAKELDHDNAKTQCALWTVAAQMVVFITFSIIVLFS